MFIIFSYRHDTHNTHMHMHVCMSPVAPEFALQSLRLETFLVVFVFVTTVLNAMPIL